MAVKPAGTAARARRRPTVEDGTFFTRVYEVVRGVPPGRVITYGGVSIALVGRPTGARTVGWALHGLPPEQVHEVPWWRVVNVAGRISTSCRAHTAEEQRARLEDEGVRFGDGDRIDLEAFGWFPEWRPRVRRTTPVDRA